MNKVHNVFTSFCYISTTIFIFSSIYIRIFWGPNATVDLSYVWGVFADALIFSLCYLPKMSDKEWSTKALLLFRVFYILVINVVVWLTGYILEWFDPSNVKMMIGMALIIVVTYFFVNLAEYISGCHQAQAINKVLKNRRENK